MRVLKGNVKMEIEGVYLTKAPGKFIVKIKHEKIKHKTGIMSYSKTKLEEEIKKFEEIPDGECSFFISIHDYIFTEIKVEVFDLTGMFGKIIIAQGRIRINKINIMKTNEITLYNHRGDICGHIYLLTSLKEDLCKIEDLSEDLMPITNEDIAADLNISVELDIINRVKIQIDEIIHDKKASYFSLIAGWIVYRRYNKEDLKRQKTIRNEIKPKNIKEIVRAMEGAVSSYGHVGISFTTRIRNITKGLNNISPDKSSIMRYLGITEEDIFILNLEERGIYKPKYIVYRDKKLNGIVISIRGTLDGKDMLTDLSYEYEDFKDGYAHKGILKSAKWVYNDISTVIPILCKQEEIKKLYIVGHSLGGGVASLLTVMMAEDITEELEDVSINCFTFGSAPSMSKNISDRHLHRIESFIFRSDIVPCLSYGSILELWEILIIIGESISFLSIFKKIGEGSVRDMILKAEETAQRHENEKLVVGGSIYHITKDPKTKKLLMYTKEQSSFSSLRITKNSFVDHLPHAYVNSLTNLEKELS
eukprot:GHVP01068555.1.p1 GENE.GHVP01068555.1~~GHVP01068555.1.p1  ORF type:complete len:533 (-),score=112.09 GHVP01068555.1:755-2353(-)